ncbi:MAG: family 43 glycosylhydrolase, partial [Acutalibacteraceae bacterium]
MFKKFLAFLTATLLLLGSVAFVYVRFLVPTKYPVFIESFAHGIMTVDNSETVGTDSKFTVTCKAGSTLTITIKPERNEKVYYNLKKLVVNGEDVTDDVSMLQYKVKVDKKLTVLAYFKKGTPSGESVNEETVSYKAPEIVSPAKNEYFGSADAYDFEDPSIIYDNASGYYYCFGSGNVVARSKDLVNWEDRTNYFPIPANADSDSLMRFSAFPSVQKWAQTHGYDSDENHSSSSNNREPHAPDIVKIGSDYYLYYSLSKVSGLNESAIFCVKTSDLEYSTKNKDWQDVGLVISTCAGKADGDKKNSDISYDASYAVDPSVFTDKNGSVYMAYGSYYGKDKINGGIYLLEINPNTGLLSKNGSLNSQGEKVSTLHGKET